MARFPTVLSEPDNVQLPGVRAVPTVPQVNAADYGAGIGQAVEKLGASLTGLGVASGQFFKQREDEIIKSDTANQIAKFDFSKTFFDLQKTTDPTAKDFGTTVANAFDEAVDKHTDGIENSAVRNGTRNAILAKREGYLQAANAFESKAVTDANKRDADDGINVATNKVRADGSIEVYNSAAQDIDRVIDTRPGLNGDMKEKMRVAAKQQLALRRFESLISNAQLDPAALGAIQEELTAKDSPWQGKLSTHDYDKVLDTIGTLTKAANSQEVAAARGALQSVHQRNQDGVIINDEELNAVQGVVAKSQRAELISQFALLKRSQQVYKDHQGLPLDQQRAKIEDMRKKGGIGALPEPIKQGIAQGAALTNGVISPEYLAGIIGAEYSGRDIAAGNYGVVNRAIDPKTGKARSDATGVGQFLSTTAIGVARANAEALGVTGKTDAEIVEMRKDPVFNLKLTALYALDNKQKLESALGRPVTDGDLYFAHFLGAAGGARFLQAADATPNAKAKDFVNPDQVAANENVFKDEGGRDRTLWQVRTLMSDRLMNGPSRQDYAGVKAGELVLKNSIAGLKDDAITFAAQFSRFGDKGDMQSAQGIAKRAIFAQQVAEYYGIPSADFKPLDKGEVEMLGKKARDGTAEETLQVMGQVAQLGVPSLIKAANKQIGEKDSIYGYAAGMSVAYPDQQGVAADIIRGEKRMKADSDLKKNLGMSDADVLAVYNQTVGKAVLTAGSGEEIRRAATAYMVQNSKFVPGHFDKNLFADSVQAVLGGGAHPGGVAITNVNGQATLLPRGMSGGEFTTALGRMTTDDYVRLSKFGGVPRYADGKPIDAAEIARQGRFEAVGAGEYRIKMGDDKYALSAAYKDGSADFYIFRGDPTALKEFALRQSVVVPLRPIVPGVQPAAPRVAPP